MGFLRIHEVAPLLGFRLRLTLTDGSTNEREVSALMVGPVFGPLRADRPLFTQARVEGGDGGLAAWRGPLSGRAYLGWTAARRGLANFAPPGDMDRGGGCQY